ncbi:MAG: hypothetical protein JW769_03240 [Parachlamydiales bacterium]|nr:hypothetical protein [Parachlamydiales bacterium]
MSKKISLQRSFVWIGLSVIGISGLSYFFYFGWPKIYAYKKSKSQVFIDTIIQTGLKKQSLPTDYLAELIGLSCDKPTHFYDFDEKEAKKKLLQSPLMDRAEVKKFFPSTVYIDYSLKKPIALLEDYENVAMDAKGYLFPYSPFFAKEDLPKIYLGLPPFGQKEGMREGGQWVIPLKDSYFDLAKTLVNIIQSQGNFTVTMIDVGQAFSASYGKREIVIGIQSSIILEYEGTKKQAIFPFYLRLSTRGYAKELGNFLTLHAKIIGDYTRQLRASTLPDRAYFSPKVIDLRLSKVAYIQE